MTRSMTVLTTQTVKIADRDEFLSLVAFARKFDDTAGGFEPFLSDAAIDYPDLNSIVATAIEQGMAFWGIPEFEQCAYQNLCWWAGEGDLVRVKFFAQWLLTTGPDIASRQWLEDFAIGNFWDYLDDRELRCPVLGKTEEYLYPFNFCRLVEAQRRCDERRTWLDLNGDRLAYEKYGWVDVENL